MTKSAGNCGFTEETLMENFIFFVVRRYCGFAVLPCKIILLNGGCSTGVCWGIVV